MRKKKWTDPKLIVLVKGKPEEWTLVGCKGINDGSGGPTESHWQCVNLGGTNVCLTSCEARVGNT